MNIDEIEELNEVIRMILGPSRRIVETRRMTDETEIKMVNGYSAQSCAGTFADAGDASDGEGGDDAK